MWDCEDEERIFVEDNYEHLSENGIDSDIEAALYGQLHHEKTDESYIVPEIITDEKFNEVCVDVNKTKRNKKSKEKSYEVSKNVEVFNVNKKKSVSVSNIFVTIPNRIGNRKVSFPIPHRVEIAEEDKKNHSILKKKQRKRKIQETFPEVSDKNSKKQVIDFTWNYLGPSPKGKRKNIESKYDYSFERNNCRLSVQEDVDNTIVLSSDTEAVPQKREKSRRQKKFDLKNNEADILDKINEKTGDLYHAYVNYEREILNESQNAKKNSQKHNKDDLFNIEDVYKLKNKDVIEISSSSNDSDDNQEMSLPLDIKLNVTETHVAPKTITIFDSPVKNQRSENKSNTIQKKKKESKKTHSRPADEILTAEEQMRRFYDSDYGEDYDVEEVIRNMTGSWYVNDLDRNMTKHDKKRYFFQNKISLRCVNCQEIGHTSKMCQKIKPLPRCYLCGSLNHSYARCWSAICPLCQLSRHKIKDCPLILRDLWERCKLCKMPGHILETCPDHWRRYYLTTKPGELVKGNDEQKRKFCYNCGSKGHLGHVCTKPRMTPTVFPNTPFVVSYDKVEFPNNQINNQDPHKLPSIKGKKQKNKHVSLNVIKAKEKLKRKRKYKPRNKKQANMQHEICFKNTKIKRKKKIKSNLF